MSEEAELGMGFGRGAVAVIVPVYNGEAFIRRALDSVLRQTYPPAEIVVIDDGSRDKTREIVAAEYGAVVRLLVQPNGGPAKARNAGWRTTHSEFIAFLDADDWWAPTKLEMQVRTLERERHAVLNYTGLRMIDEGSGEENEFFPLPPESLRGQLRWCNPGIPPSCVMARRSALERVGGFNERQVGSEDWCLWFELCAVGQACTCTEPLTGYRVSAGGLSGNATHMFNDFMKMLEDVLLRELSGFDKIVWRRRIISYQAYKAVLTARGSGNRQEEVRFMKKSLAAWPSPFWIPERFKAFAVTMLRSKQRALDTTGLAR